LSLPVIIDKTLAVRTMPDKVTGGQGLRGNGRPGIVGAEHVHVASRNWLSSPGSWGIHRWSLMGWDSNSGDFSRQTPSLSGSPARKAAQITGAFGKGEGLGLDKVK